MEVSTGGKSAMADRWAQEASTLPLAFAQVREDPRLDVELLRTLPECESLVMIASGGDTLVQLARERSIPILAVDVNPAQLALSRWKCHLAGQGDAGRIAGLLGHDWMPAEERERVANAHWGTLGLDPSLFGPRDQVCCLGVDQCGRYEKCFAELRKELGEWVEEFPADHLEAALDRVMSLPNLVALFGEHATQNPRVSFARHFAERTRKALERPDAGQNPFLRQMYSGRFSGDCRYDWMNCARPLRATVEFHRDSMDQVLAGLASGSQSMVHLSNILDWLTPGEAARVLQLTARALHLGGKTILRQLNSSLSIPELGPDFHWDTAAGLEMVKKDRSFFYPQIHVGIRK